MLRPSKGKRIATEVAQKLRGYILRGHYKIGDKLPPERKLAEDLGVNRATLREALKNLEHMGLVRIRQGDGTRVLDFLQTAGLDLLGHLIPLSGDQLATHARVDLLQDVLEFRQFLGREMARLAAERITPDQLKKVREIVRRDSRTPQDVFLQDLDFYCELGQASKNICFSLLLNSVRGAVRSFAGVFATFNPSVDEVRAHHKALVEALEAGDGARASHIAEEHFIKGKERFLQEHTYAVEPDEPAVPEPALEELLPAAEGGERARA